MKILNNSKTPLKTGERKYYGAETSNIGSRSELLCMVRGLLTAVKLFFNITLLYEFYFGIEIAK